MLNSTCSHHGFLALLVTASLLSGSAQAQLQPSNQVIPEQVSERQAPLSLATATKDQRKPDPDLPPNKSLTRSPLNYDRERVEVLARSITFPYVLNLGKFLLSVEYPNSTLLCLDAAYYAGKVQGLIWAMDRDTVMEHELQWTIDNAKDLFDTCLSILLREAVAEQNVNDKNPPEDVKEILSEKIRFIQQRLNFAYGVETKADEGFGCIPSTRFPNN